MKLRADTVYAGRSFALVQGSEICDVRGQFESVLKLISTATEYLAAIHTVLQLSLTGTQIKTQKRLLLPSPKAEKILKVAQNIVSCGDL